MNKYKQAAKNFLIQIGYYTKYSLVPVRQSKLGYCFKDYNLKMVVANNMKDCYDLAEREFGTRIPHTFGISDRKYIIIIK